MTGDRDEEEFRRDERVLLAARAMDPAPGRSVLSPELSPARIIELARQGRSERPRERAQARRLAAVAIAVLAAAIVIPILARRITVGDPLTAGAELTPVSYYAGDGSVAPGGPPLRGVADAAARSVVDVSGPVTYIRVRTWSRDTTATSFSATTRDEQLWWTADRSGLSVVTTLDGWHATAGTADPLRVVYGPREVAVVVEQPSADPALLAAQLDEHEPLINGPQAVLRGVRDLYRYHALDGPGRSAALRVLAETPGVEVRGIVTLESGRAGLVVSTDSERGAVRDLAVFDPADGSLLAYQQVTLRRTPASASGQPSVTFALVVLVNGTTDAIGSPDIRRK